MPHSFPHRPAILTPAQTPTRPRRKIAIVSTYPPRACGIATFTADLRHGLSAAAPDLEVVVVAVDRDRQAYGPEVHAVIDQDDPEDYPAAARRLAAEGVAAVLIQHEFGIFGGPDGAWILDFAAALTAVGIPYLTTLHTVVSQPTPGQARVLRQLCGGAAAVTVFTPTAHRLAVTAGIAAPGRIHVIGHGAPDILYPAARRTGRNPRPEVAAALAGLQGATVASTFGLISPNKGLETAITAVARLAAELPDLRYLIAGATHPEVARHHGQDYRHTLTALADDLGVADRIVLLDHFLTDTEIAAVLQASTVFLTPYRSVEQVSSGALTFALAAGVPAVSTDYHYARDMLADGAGITVPPGDDDAFTSALRTMLTEPGRLAAATAAARRTGDRLRWTTIAASLADVVHTTTGRPAAPTHARQPRPTAVLRTA
ncbi:glycosyltransferase [Catenulispora subtropica]|uniref:Glycosyl transferase family 1 domain-containing protein n=1 Tax=Catenulispora subtropica TaxID=450798 RepID=A0ABN2R7M4_9ACTN